MWCWHRPPGCRLITSHRIKLSEPICVAHHTSSFLKLVSSWFHPSISFLNQQCIVSSLSSQLHFPVVPFLLPRLTTFVICQYVFLFYDLVCSWPLLLLHQKPKYLDIHTLDLSSWRAHPTTSALLYYQHRTQNPDAKLLCAVSNCRITSLPWFKAPHEADLRVAATAIIKMCMNLLCRLFPTMTLTQDIGTSMNMLRVLQ